MEFWQKKQKQICYCQMETLKYFFCMLYEIELKITEQIIKPCIQQLVIWESFSLSRHYSGWSILWDFSKKGRVRWRRKRARNSSFFHYRSEWISKSRGKEWESREGRDILFSFPACTSFWPLHTYFCEYLHRHLRNLHRIWRCLQLLSGVFEIMYRFFLFSSPLSNILQTVYCFNPQDLPVCSSARCKSLWNWVFWQNLPNQGLDIFPLVFAA